MSIPMAIADLIPVILFLIAGLILMRDLYHLMSKGAYALFAAGIILIFTAGAGKALWKLLYAAGICDFTALNEAFFPMQSTGFLLGCLGMCGLLFFPQRTAAAYVMVPVYTSKMPFVIITVLGTLGIWGGLAVIAGKMNRKKEMILLSVSFVCMLAMGYLSGRDFTVPAMNWIGEAVNIAGMSLLLSSVLLLHRHGLDTFEIH